MANADHLCPHLIQGGPRWLTSCNTQHNLCPNNAGALGSQVSYSLNSLKGVFRGLLYGFLRRIPGV